MASNEAVFQVADELRAIGHDTRVPLIFQLYRGEIPAPYFDRLSPPSAINPAAASFSKTISRMSSAGQYFVRRTLLRTRFVSGDTNKGATQNTAAAHTVTKNDAR